MKMLSVLTLTLLVSTSAYAQRGGVRSNNDFSTPTGQNTATAYLGFGSGAVNVGGDFEAIMSSDAGVGGYFMFLSEAENDFNATVRPEVIAFGANAKVHYRPSSWDLYAAPGFGIAMVEANNDDETTFGPSMRIGVLYAFSPGFSVGLEHVTLFNWFSDKAGSDIETANAAFRINF